MKRSTINFICALFLLSIGFTSCERHYYEGRRDRDNRMERRHHHDRGHDDRDRRDFDHRDNR